MPSTAQANTFGLLTPGVTPGGFDLAEFKRQQREMSASNRGDGLANSQTTTNTGVVSGPNAEQTMSPAWWLTTGLLNPQQTRMASLLSQTPQVQDTARANQVQNAMGVVNRLETISVRTPQGLANLRADVFNREMNAQQNPYLGVAGQNEANYASQMAAMQPIREFRLEQERVRKEAEDKSNSERAAAQIQAAQAARPAQAAPVFGANRQRDVGYWGLPNYR